MKFVLLLGVVLVLLAPCTATAAPFAYPAQAPVTDARSLGAIQVAVAYWRARGETACPGGVQTFTAASLMDADGVYALGRGGDCQAALARQPLRTVRELPDFPTIRDRRFTAQEECGEWTHEVGHALGLGHTTDSGVMDPLHRGMPVECVLWARRVYPAKLRSDRPVVETAPRGHHASGQLRRRHLPRPKGAGQRGL